METRVLPIEPAPSEKEIMIPSLSLLPLTLPRWALGTSESAAFCFFNVVGPICMLRPDSIHCGLFNR